jgi:WXG100 family type VII secretion target
MTRLAVDVEMLDEFVAEMAAFENRIDAGWHALAGPVAALHATWRGAAATEQRCAQQQLADAADTMRSALLQLRAAAQTASANYESAMRANATIWAR